MRPRARPLYESRSSRAASLQPRRPQLIPHGARVDEAPDARRLRDEVREILNEVRHRRRQRAKGVALGESCVHEPHKGRRVLRPPRALLVGQQVFVRFEARGRARARSAAARRLRDRDRRDKQLAPERLPVRVCEQRGELG